MSYSERIQNAVEYIERNLENDIDLRRVADKAYYSLYHFHRVFNVIVGDTIADYIRKRRLSNAALELITTKKKVIEIALDNGYEAPESFTRAFKRQYGISPSVYRKNGESCHHYMKADIAKLMDTSEGEIMQEPKIITKPEFDIIGYELRTKADGSNFEEIPKFWTDVLMNDKISKIPNRKNTVECLGLCANYDCEKDEFSYLACSEVTSTDNIPENMTHIHVPTGKYAVFTAKGMLPKSVQDLTTEIYKTWLPNSKYDHAMAPEFELYDERTTNDDNCEVDIYIPIIEKK